MKASAVVFPEPNKVEFREVTCPDPGPQHVVVRLTHSWISVGTEGSFLRGERITGYTPYYERRNPLQFALPNAAHVR